MEFLIRTMCLCLTFSEMTKLLFQQCVKLLTFPHLCQHLTSAFILISCSSRYVLESPCSFTSHFRMSYGVDYLYMYLLAILSIRRLIQSANIFFQDVLRLHSLEVFMCLPFSCLLLRCLFWLWYQDICGLYELRSVSSCCISGQSVCKLIII